MKYVSISGGLASRIEFDMKRGRTFQNIASMLYCCEEVDLQRTPSALQLDRWLNELKGPSRVFKFRVERMLSNLLEIASDKALNKGFTGFSAKVSPAEFVFIGMWSLSQPSGRSMLMYFIVLQVSYSLRCVKTPYTSATDIGQPRSSIFETTS